MSVKQPFTTLVKQSVTSPSTLIDLKSAQSEHSEDDSRSATVIVYCEANFDGKTSPPSMKILGASSDHLVVNSGNYRNRLRVRSELTFQLNYSTLLLAMTSPHIAKTMSIPTAGQLTSV